MPLKTVRSKYAFDVFTYRIKKYLGAYASSMGGLDAFIFTGGIGENSPDIRKAVCDDLEFLGIKIDDDKNQNNELEISTSDSKVAVLRIPTNEELVIALDTMKIVQEKTKEVLNS